MNFNYKFISINYDNTMTVALLYSVLRVFPVGWWLHTGE